MISKKLQDARDYEEREGALVSPDERPLLHLSPLIGWLNDPNGFSYYDGKYHLFYQYHPYSSFWGPMHWGHAVSSDLISWEYLPAALAPDAPYDGGGCFSGTAITLPDGRQLLMYTGCDENNIDELGRWCQTQCVAVSSVPGSSDYIKFVGNPVLTEDDMPEDGDTFEFRDPYIWQANDGTYRAAVASARKGDTGDLKRSVRGGTQISMYRSDDCFRWEMDKVLFEDNAKIGIMWECPNFFPLPDYSAPSGPADSGVSTYVLIASPMDMELEDAEGSIRFPKGNNVCYMVGDFDEETEEFTPHQSASHEKRYRNQSEVYATYHPVDCGLDFYAPQVMKAPDGRTIMIGWMQDPSTSNLHNDEDFRIFGQMSIPRELRLRKGRLLQRPVREIESYRTGRFICASVELDSETRTIDGISGRTLDMEIEISPKSWSDAVMCSLDEFSLRFARDYEHYVELTYRPDSSVVTIDRSMSGQNDEMTKRRSIRVRERRGTISLRILIDRYSAEVFINGGEQVMSATYYTPLEAEGITFSAEGSAIVDISAYQLGRKGE